MSETALKLHEAPAPAVVLTKEDIRKYICPEATDKEIFMFLGICKSFGLNPMKREVHLIKYGNSPASIVTGYEVYLKRAERTGKLNGWNVELDNNAKDGTKATVTIHRKDWDKPFTWTAYRQEFDKGQANWKSMPSFMLRKVAIAQAFRICFPDEMGGLPYLPEEISEHNSEALPAQAIDAEIVDAAPPAQSPPEAPPPVQGEEPPPAPPAAPPIKSADDPEGLRSHLSNLMQTASDILPEKYPTAADALRAWTDYKTKDGKSAGYKDILKMKDWQMKKAIGIGEKELEEIVPVEDDPEWIK